jgi:hypothetical protein
MLFAADNSLLSGQPRPPVTRNAMSRSVKCGHCGGKAEMRAALTLVLAIVGVIAGAASTGARVIAFHRRGPTRLLCPTQADADRWGVSVSRSGGECLVPNRLACWRGRR